MTAISSTIPESTAAEQRAHEPSMEEILASIRKIISDDQALPISARGGAEEETAAKAEERPAQRPVSPVREPEADRMRPPPLAPRSSLDLGASFSAAPPARPSRPEPVKPVAEVRELPPRPAAPAPRLVAKDEAPLLSGEADKVVASSFQALNAARSAQTPQIVEAVARDLLRPMLKQWLDDNLPSLVERLVRAEIERLARGDR